MIVVTKIIYTEQEESSSQACMLLNKSASFYTGARNRTQAAHRRRGAREQGALTIYRPKPKKTAWLARLVENKHSHRTTQETIDYHPRNSQQQSNYDSRDEQRRNRIVKQTENPKLRLEHHQSHNKTTEEEKSKRESQREDGKLGFPDMMEANTREISENKEIQRCWVTPTSLSRVRRAEAGVKRRKRRSGSRVCRTSKNGPDPPAPAGEKQEKGHEPNYFAYKNVFL